MVIGFGGLLVSAINGPKFVDWVVYRYHCSFSFH